MRLEDDWVVGGTLTEVGPVSFSDFFMREAPNCRCNFLVFGVGGMNGEGFSSFRRLTTGDGAGKSGGRHEDSRSIEDPTS